MDIFVLERVVKELREIVAGTTVRNIYCLPDNTLAIELSKREGNIYLILSASSQFPRIYLDNVLSFKPIKSSFSNTLNVHLENARLTLIEQISSERIVEFTFERLTLWRELEKRKIVVEIMGKHSNIILCRDDYVIIDAIKHIDLTKSRVRQVLPGLLYTYPPKRETLPFSQLEDYIIPSEIKLEEFFIKNVIGITPITIEEICARACLDKKRLVSSLDSNELASLKRAIKSFRDDLEDIKPVVYLDENGNPESYYIFPLSFKDNPYEQYEFLVSACARYYDWVIPNLFLENRKRSIIKEISSEIEALEKKKRELLDSLNKLKDPERWRLYGDMILAYSTQIPSGVDRFSVEWDGEVVEIPLDSNKTSIENAQEYYQRYKKEKREREVIPELISDIEKKIEELQKKIEDVSNLEDLETERVKEEKKESLPFLVYNFKGYQIWVGKNAKSNELITFKLSSPSDIWFHAKGYSGSHVILRTNGKAIEYIPEDVILECARLAVEHSKARSGTKVPVDYTYRRNVRGAGKKKGNVFYTNYKTVIV
ncbi:MAG: NFACT family protein [bacterium]|nr:NFACT family protein [bacterium]